ncbi:hypothetical protein TNCV_3769171 [Trichonephila clavipes]|nr:hypothetical protein TNCV_3769171 [Trichonephila clavipes]
MNGVKEMNSDNLNFKSEPSLICPKSDRKSSCPRHIFSPSQGSSAPRGRSPPGTVLSDGIGNPSRARKDEKGSERDPNVALKRNQHYWRSRHLEPRSRTTPELALLSPNCHTRPFWSIDLLLYVI